MDPIQAAQDSERNDRLPFIAPEKIYYKYTTLDDGSIKQDLWVNWRKKGQQHGNVTPEQWSRLVKNPENEIYKVLKPYVDHFLKGETDPVNGIPLGAWPGGTPELTEALNSVNIRSVEDLARMEDHQLTKLAIPGIRDKQKHARAYLDALRGTAQVSSELAKLREQVEGLSRRNAELTALVNKEAPPEVTDQAPQVTLQPAKNKGGRPKGSTNKSNVTPLIGQAQPQPGPIGHPPLPVNELNVTTK